MKTSKKKRAKRTNGKANAAAKKPQRAVSTTANGQSPRQYPVEETLAWIAEGQQLLHKWGAIRSPAAKRTARRVDRVLTMLGTINEIRKM